MNNKSKLSNVTILFVILILIFTISSLTIAAPSIMKYTYKSEDSRDLDWQIAQRLEDGKPNYNYYFNYYNEGENNSFYQGQQTIYKCFGEEGSNGSTYVWVNGTLQNGNLETYVNTDN